MSLKQDAG